MPRLSYRSLPIALLRARERLMSEFWPMLAGHDVTEQQWRVLKVVSEESSIEFSVAAERTCLQAPSLSRIVATLESKKLIRR